MSDSKEQIVEQEKKVEVVALVKGRERYVFVYTEQNRTGILRTLGRYASEPDLSFSWYDAAVLSQKIRRRNQQKTISTLQGSGNFAEH